MTPFERLLTDPYASRHYLVELFPWDPFAEAEVAFYFSDHGFTTEPDEVPANQHFEARVVEALNFQRSLYQPGAIGGASIPDFGEILLDNADGGLDSLRGLAFDGRRVEVRLGGEGFRYDDFGLVFAGTAQSAVADEAQVSVRLRDLQYKLESPIRTALYEAPGDDALDLVFGLVPTGGNDYLYATIGGAGGYTLQAGDVLEYDVRWPDEGPGPQGIAVELETTLGPLRSTGAVDQNGLSVHPGTDLSARAVDAWYHREIPIPAELQGGQITFDDVVCEYDVPAGTVKSLVRGRIRDVVITDGAGTVRQSIWASTDPVPVFGVHLASDALNTVDAVQLLTLEGDPNLEGKPRPLCFGKCLNVTPVLASPAYLTHQVHNGPIQEIDKVYDNGVELVRDPQNPDPANDQYVVDHERGTFTLQQAFVGPITADVRGDATGGVYVETAADIVSRILTDFGPLTAADLDTATFDALNAISGETLGLYITDERDILDVLDELVNSVGGHYGFSRAGLFCVGRFETPDRWPCLVLDGVDDQVAVDGLFYDRNDYTALSVEAWIRTSTDGRIIASWDRSEYWRLAVGNVGFPGKLTLHIYDSANAAVQDLGGTADIVDDRWHHVAVVFDAGRIDFYVDGKPDATHQVGATFGRGGGVVRYGFLGVGSEADVFNGAINDLTQFEGRLTEVRVWHVARSQAEIAADMHRRLGGGEPGLVGYWKLDEGAGSTVADATAAAHHGVVAGGAGWSAVDATFTAADVLELEALPTELPLWRQRVSYQRNWTVQSTDSVAGSVSEERRAFLAEEQRLATARDPAVKTHHLLARDPEPIGSLFDAETAARAEAARLLGLYSVRREMFRVTVKTQPFRLELGDQVSLVFPRFGLDDGRVFRVVGLEEQAENNRVTLELWG